MQLLMVGYLQYNVNGKHAGSKYANTQLRTSESAKTAFFEDQEKHAKFGAQICHFSNDYGG